MPERVLHAQAGGAQHGVHPVEDDGARRHGGIERRIGSVDRAGEDEIADAHGVNRRAERRRHALRHDLGAVRDGRGDGVHAHQPAGAELRHADEAGGGRALGPERGLHELGDCGGLRIVGEHHVQEHDVVGALADRRERAAKVLQRALGLRHGAGRQLARTGGVLRHERQSADGGADRERRVLGGEPRRLRARGAGKRRQQRARAGRRGGPAQERTARRLRVIEVRLPHRCPPFGALDRLRESSVGEGSCAVTATSARCRASPTPAAL